MPHVGHAVMVDRSGRAAPRIGTPESEPVGSGRRPLVESCGAAPPDSLRCREDRRVRALTGRAVRVGWRQTIIALSEFVPPPGVPSSGSPCETHDDAPGNLRPQGPRRAQQRRGPVRAGHPGGLRRRLGGRPGGWPGRRPGGRPGPRRRPAAEAPHHPHPRHDPQDHRLERLAGPPLRPLHQPLPGLRARVHLLLRAAEPCVPRVLARPRLRDADRVQAGGRGAAARGARQAGIHVRPDRAGDQHRSLPAGRARPRDHPRRPRSARRMRASGDDRHQVRAGRTRPRPPRPHGPRQPLQRQREHHHPRPRPRPPHGAARLRPPPPPRNGAPPDRGGGSRPGCSRPR